MDEISLVEAITEYFREYGFDAELSRSAIPADGELMLEKGGMRRAFALEVKVPLTLEAIRHRPSSYDVVYVTDQVSTRTAEALRRMGIHFIDVAGNAFLATDGWFLDVRGRKKQQLLETSHLRLDSSPNLYSAKRAQVVFALLTWSDLLEAPVRALSTAAGVSVGIAQSTAAELRRRELWPDHPEPRSILIDGWAAAFPESLGRSLTIRRLRAEQFDRFFGPVAVSGEAAPSAQMRATSGVVYVDELSNELLVMNRWRTDGPRNLIIRRRFWSHPSVRDDEAPPLLVYGDLLASDDPRVRAVANDYRARL